MRSFIASLLFGALVASAPMLLTSPAQAGLADCGNIDVKANAQCEVFVEGGCTAKCEPVSFTAACQGQCSGSCTAQASASCTADCSGSCSGECNANPGNYSCSASCEADCSGSCGGSCSGKANAAECQASCKATCQGECGASCEGTPPSATCEAKCDASCQGSCKGEANIDCQASCQGSCSANLQGGCKARCESPDGALFCNGQYVDTGDHLDKCIAALEATLQIKVKGYARGDAECSGGSCTAEAEAGVSCALSPQSHTGRMGYAVAGTLVALGALFARRRRA